MKQTVSLLILLAVVAGGFSRVDAEEPVVDRRAKAKQLQKNGNFKDALEVFRTLALDPANEAGSVGEDLKAVQNCLMRLGSIDELDEIMEKVVAVHQKNWMLLATAAEIYTQVQHDGFVVAGKFSRGQRHGNTGEYKMAQERDRIRGLQLMKLAMEMSTQEPNKSALSQFYNKFASYLMNVTYGQTWRLQALSDLTVLPDYETWGGYYGGENRAPVDADGNPVFYKIPKSFDAASSDGERWRWCLMQAMELSPTSTPAIRLQFAAFLRNQFDVHTAAGYSRFFNGEEDGVAPGGDGNGKQELNAAFSVRTLGEDESIARLASGIKRFKLPDEFNFIKIYQEIAADGKAGAAQQALDALAQIFQDRQQFEKAADCIKKSIAAFGDHSNQKQQRLNQILGNWGQFEPLMMQPAGKGATVEYRFRNGNKVSFVANEIDMNKLIGDVKAYIKTKPKQLDWQKIDMSNIGYRLVERNEQQYIGAQAAAWDLELKPRESHFDRRVTVETPLQKAGAYLLTATMANGNTSKIVIWVADTVIVKKQLDKQAYYFTADAMTGQPVAGANFEFFGYRMRWDNNMQNIDVQEFTQQADADGQVMPEPAKLSQEYQWIATARTADGRFASVGFSNVWYGNYYDNEYNATKAIVITDRPVYRPNQSAKFKVWIAQTKYDIEGKSPFSGQEHFVQIHNPKGEKVFEKGFKVDEFGGFDGEFPLDKDATLGVYGLTINGIGGGSFRLEEYKKPEFEVKVDAPVEPVMLGEKVTATISAKYFFGAPVTEAKVKYKILRHNYSANWYPTGSWDWFYNPGYWWFACDYNWYPGWQRWGCARPYPWWFGPRQEAPEVVMENEVPIGADGTVKVVLDTAVAKAVHGNSDHKYDISVEVTDQSRRTIVGSGTVMVARNPFKVYAWVDRGHYRVGDVVNAEFNAQTLDNKPVKGKGKLNLFKLAYDKDGLPVEKPAQQWDLDTDEQGRAHTQIKGSEAGQYRLSYKVADAKGHEIEGGYVFCVAGAGQDGAQYRFNDIELVTDKREYKPEEKVNLRVNADRADSTVVLFIRPANGVYLRPEILRLKGKSLIQEIEVVKKDMPNFFIEAFTISNGKVYSETREIIVPPESRVLEVTVTPSAIQYKPGEKAKAQIKLVDITGEPFVGSTVIAIYDKAVEYISGGSNVPEIKSHFWKWRRTHYAQTQSSLDHYMNNLAHSGVLTMQFLGAFGYEASDELAGGTGGFGGGKGMGRGVGMARSERQSLRKAGALQDGAAMPMAPAAAGAAPMEAMDAVAEKSSGDRRNGAADKQAGEQQAQAQPAAMVEPTTRKNFADTALWVASLTTNKNGIAEIDWTMPENLTAWKIKVWAMGAGTRVGQGDVEVVTSKNLLVRLQAPRFFTQKDEVVLSANIHNYLKTKKSVQAILELEGGCIEAPADLKKSVEIEPNSEKRVDWRVKVSAPGEAVVRVKALTDEESDAMEMRFPAYVHGMMKVDSYSGAIAREKDSASITFNVPQDRRVADSRLEVRYSPTLAGAMVDALPYLVDYPYGCTEQTLNRFLPTVMTQKVLMRMNLNLKEVQQKITNLNAQEIGDDVKRAKQWQRGNHNPVFDEAEVANMVKAGVKRLAAMQVGDGGWGWFSGWGEQSYPHTTAYVVHGMQLARRNDVALEPNSLERGVQWLKNYQDAQVRMIKNAPGKVNPYKLSADNLDAFIYMVMTDAKIENNDMREFLYRDRNNLAVYSKAMFGIALQKVNDNEKLNMVLRNIEQFLVQDEENQTAYLKLPEDNYWWYWYGSEYEAQAYYLKLLSATDPKGEKASRLVKYLINNRKHASYWNSTRDTAVCIEAISEYLTASGEDGPDLTLEILVDGKKSKEVAISGSNLFTFDNKLVLTGEAISAGAHTVEFKKKGRGPLYFNVYNSNFTLEDHIGKAGLEIKVNRKYYKLNPVDKTVKAEGAHGQALDQKVEKYERQELAELATLKSGDLVEIEMEIDSKNDYEYILFEDMKAAGFEPVDTRSGYNGNSLNAYMELRDERVCFFVPMLARGKHSVSYRMRAEIPGKFNALPTRASAMYAPELKANSDEIKLNIED